MRRALCIVALAATAALGAAPFFTNQLPLAPPGARRSSAGALRPGGTTDTFLSFGGFNGGTLTELLEYRTLANGWQTRAPGLPGRERHGMGYDPLHDVFVIVGGANGLTVFDSVFLIDGTTGAASTPPSPPLRPSARIDPLLEWIPEWGKFLYFGGRTSVFASSHVNDLWTLDVGDGGVTWAQVPQGSGPSARGAVCGALDPNTGRLLVFGGEGSSMLGDTWSYRPDAGTWSQLTVTGTAPSARGFAACAWDPNLNELVLYGGQTTAPVGGLFSFDPATNVWTSWAPPANPGPLSDSAAAFSPALGGTIFFAGRTGASTYTNQTWLLTFNAPPVVDAGPDQTVPENAAVQLSGDAFDPDGDPLLLDWTQTAGPVVALSDAGVLAPTFFAPRVVAPVQLTFVLRATDGAAGATDDVTVTVQNTVNEAPVANAGPDQTVDAGALVSLLGAGSDPNSDPIVSVSWSQLAGPSVTLSAPNALATTFTAPEPSIATALTFALVVNDGSSPSPADQLTVIVLAFDAGVDAGFDGGTDAGLDGGRPDGGDDAGARLDGGDDAGERDGGDLDAGAPDAAVADSGVDDAGSDDAGAPDAAVADAGAGDAGADAGADDAGSDGGPGDGGLVAGAGPLEKRELAVGCGCTEAPFSAACVLGLLALTFRARRRARGS